MIVTKVISLALLLLVMGHIYEPIKDWQIKVRTTFDKEIFTDGKMKTVADLRQYFTVFKRRGEVFGYVLEKNRPQAWAGEDLVKKVEVTVEYTDQMGLTINTFETLELFVHHLALHPELAKCVGYVPKR